MIRGDKFTLLNARLTVPCDLPVNWELNNPPLLMGEIVFDSDTNKIKVGTGKNYSETPFLYAGIDRVYEDYSNLPAVDDANFKPPGSTGRNVEDWIQTRGDIVYPITTTTAVKFKSGTSLDAWANNRTPLILKNISIPLSGWNVTTKKYDFTHTGILEIHSPDVRFAASSIDAAGMAGIIVYTTDGHLFLEATNDIPEADMVIEVAYFDSTISII